MFLLPCKYLLSEIASMRLASPIDLDAPGLLIVANCCVSMTSEKRLWPLQIHLKEGKGTISQDVHPSFGARLARPYSHPCKADIYFCIFYRWIQCRPWTPLATLRNRVKWMYVLVSETHVMFQLSVLDPNRLELSCVKRNRFPRGRTTIWLKWSSDFEENKNGLKIKSLQKGNKPYLANKLKKKSSSQYGIKEGCERGFAILSITVEKQNHTQ